MDEVKKREQEREREKERLEEEARWKRKERMMSIVQRDKGTYRCLVYRDWRQ